MTLSEHAWTLHRSGENCVGTLACARGQVRHQNESGDACWLSRGNGANACIPRDDIVVAWHGRRSELRFGLGLAKGVCKSKF